LDYNCKVFRRVFLYMVLYYYLIDFIDFINFIIRLSNFYFIIILDFKIAQNYYYLDLILFFRSLIIEYFKEEPFLLLVRFKLILR
jgi:hypothetical protein